MTMNKLTNILNSIFDLDKEIPQGKEQEVWWPNNVSLLLEHKAWLYSPNTLQVSKGHQKNFLPNGISEEMQYSILGLIPK